MAKKILVVEDDENWQETLRQILERAGYQVFLAFDRESALKQFIAKHPDLVTMDGRLYGDNGLDIAGDIRKFNPTAPIVMLTGEGDVKFEGRGLDKGSFDSSTFRALVTELLGE